jgi:tRNA (guanine-N7-)-methyltransferase
MIPPSTVPSRLYGRKQTRPLSPQRKAAFDSQLAALGIPPTLIARQNITQADLFHGTYDQFWFEIGFGNGEHLKLEMERHPNHAYIGAEPFVNGMAAFLKSVADLPCDNVRVHMNDAIQLVDALADGILDGIFILNPDPWPKKRHFKRRIVQTDTVEKFVRVLKPGGKLIMTTDIDELAAWMGDIAAANPNLHETSPDRHTPPPGWVATKYERKGAAKGRAQTYMIFEKV